MNINVLASSSKGNAYIIDDCKCKLLVEAGIPYKDIQIKSNFEVNNICGCILSHVHKDHSKAVKDLVKRAIDVYMPEDTAKELNICNHRIHSLNAGDTFSVGTFLIRAVEMYHDVTCYGYLIKSTINNETVFFATDTWKITVDPDADYIIVEINYQIEKLNEYVNIGVVEPAIRKRLIYSHQELSTALNWLDKISKNHLKRIYIAHLSRDNSDEEYIKQRVIEVTGVPTVICEE